jgi:L-aminopeptidase/D-esterase-like protein
MKHFVARHVGIVVGTLPTGRLNAITDVAGVLVTKAETMTGINGNRVHAIPYGRLRTAMAKYGR